MKTWIWLVIILLIIGIGFFFFWSYGMQESSEAKTNYSKPLILENFTGKFVDYGETYGEATKQEIQYLYNEKEFNVQIINFEDNDARDRYYDFLTSSIENQGDSYYKNKTINGKQIVVLNAEDFDTGKFSQGYLWKSKTQVINIFLGVDDSSDIFDEFAIYIMKDYPVN